MCLLMMTWGGEVKRIFQRRVCVCVCVCAKYKPSRKQDCRYFEVGVNKANGWKQASNLDETGRNPDTGTDTGGLVRCTLRSNSKPDKRRIKSLEPSSKSQGT